MMRKILKSISQKLLIDPAVMYGIMSKVWTGTAGLITAFLIVKKYNPIFQGFYYTFISLLSLQIFVELGLGTVIIQYASHEWSLLRMKEDSTVDGDKNSLSRLQSLFKIVTKWYFVGGVILIIVLTMTGFFFFNKVNTEIEWKYPWVALSIFSGLNIMLSPFWTILEGCNQVRKVYKFRLYISVISSVILWIAIILNFGLWVVCISSLATLVFGILLLSLEYLNFFRTLNNKSIGYAVISWRKEIFPMQWRMSVSWISGYFAFFIFVPFLFRFQGPKIAGQFGMTLIMANFLNAIANAWLAPKVPQFGMLIASRNFTVLDQLFYKLTKVITLLLLFSATLLYTFTFFLHYFQVSFAARILDYKQMGLLLMSQVVLLVSAPFAAYLRAHKREPLLVPSVIFGILTGYSTYFFAKYTTVNEVIMGYLVINIIITPIVINIWKRYRVNWHK